MPEGGGLRSPMRVKEDSRKSMTLRLVEFVHEKIFSTTEAAAKHFRLQERYVESLLRQRRDGVGDVVKVGDFWQRGEPKGDRSAVAARITRPFRAWDGQLNGAAVRPGGLEYRQIPSLMGDKRVDYMTGKVL